MVAGDKEMASLSRPAIKKSDCIITPPDLRKRQLRNDQFARLLLKRKRPDIPAAMTTYQVLKLKASSAGQLQVPRSGCEKCFQLDKIQGEIKIPD